MLQTSKRWSKINVHTVNQNKSGRKEFIHLEPHVLETSLELYIYACGSKCMHSFCSNMFFLYYYLNLHYSQHTREGI